MSRGAANATSMRTDADRRLPFARGKHQQHYGTLPDLTDPSSEGDWQVPILFSYRFFVATIGHLGMICSLASQSILGASLLTMTRNNSAVNQSETLPAVAPVFVNDTVDSRWYYPWSKGTQSWILFAYFLGYYVVQIPAGYLTQKLGNKRLVLFGTIVLALLQGVAVFAPRFGAAFFSITMALSGFANGCTYPPLMNILAKWAPPQESSVLVNIASSGCGIGIGLVYGLSACTSYIQLWGGWPFNFIALGGVVLVLVLLVSVLVTDTPEENRFISAKELHYITHCTELHRLQKEIPENTPGSSVPWLKILTSAPVYAIAVSQLGSDCLLYFFINLFPFYLKHVRSVNIDGADMLAGLPWLGFPFYGYVVSRIVDNVRQRGVSTTFLRKVVDFWAKMAPAGLLVGMVFLPEGYEASLVVMQVLCVALVSMFGSSWAANMVDLSAEYAGFVSSVSQVIALPCSFVLPLVVEALTPNNTPEEWQRCVWVIFGIVTTSYIFYVTFGSSEPKNWDTSNAPALPSRGDSDVADKTPDYSYLCMSNTSQ